MIGKTAAICGALSLAFSTPAGTTAPGVFLLSENHPLIKRVDCMAARGTAFRVGEGAYVSVDHVTSKEGCFIDGEPVNVTHASKVLDFSTIRVTKHSARRFELSCDGFIEGRIYLALGHARGADRQTVVPLVYEGDRNPDGLAILRGNAAVIPGMSGGPLIDTVTGKVAGTVNAYNPVFPLSASRAIKDTAYCTGVAHA